MSNQKPDWVPKGVQIHHGRFRKLVSENGKRVWVALSLVSEGRKGLEAALRDYAARAILAGPPATVRDLVREYLNHLDKQARENDEDALSPQTRAEYWRIFERSPLMPYFGDANPNDVKRRDVQTYLKGRAKDGAKVMGNRERALLSSAYTYGVPEFDLDSNPCLGVKRNKERGSKKYVKDAHFEGQLAALPAHIADACEFCYLTGFRQADIVVRITRDCITKEGIDLDLEGKTATRTGKGAFVYWSDALRACVDRALARQALIAAKPADPRKHRAHRPEIDQIFANSRNQPLTGSAIRSAINRLGEDKTHCFRDIRPKAATDARRKDQKANLLGHHGQMESLYDRKRFVNPTK